MCCCRKKKQLFITKVPARRSCNKPRNISRKERQNRRLPVKIIRKSVYLSPPNLATLRLGASSFRLRIRSASRSFAQVTQISTCTKSTKFRSLNISILPFVRFAVSNIIYEIVKPAGLNFGSQTSLEACWNATETFMPSLTSSTGQFTMLVIMRGPSSRSTQAIT